MAVSSTHLRTLILVAFLARAIQAQAMHSQRLVRSEHTDSAGNQVLLQEEVHVMDEGALIATSVRAHDFEAGPHKREPCGYIGCNSRTCAWKSGGAITKHVSGKTCSNAIMLGSTEGHDNVDAATAPNLGAQSNYKISDLRDCVHAVKKQNAICSGHFQMNMDTWSCSCIPASGDCTEIEDHKVCRYMITE